ncbi:MAG: GAF domain-containing sensor histidine kinase [Acidimicrobiales bacterium]
MPFRSIDDPAVLRRLLAAVLLVEADLDLPRMLHQLVEEACSITGARYGALGVLDDDGTGLAEFVTFGIEPELREKIGPPPQGRGVLGLLISTPEPIRLADISRHPESHGFPPHHPAMTSFLGVPVKIRRRVYGNLYLTDKIGWAEFTRDDQILVEALATTAGVAIENAQLHRQARRSAVLEDRSRISQDLHDTVIQRLFAVGLTLQGLSRALDRPGAAERLCRAVDDIDDTIRQIRATIFELGMESHDRPTGLRASVTAIARALADGSGLSIPVRFEGAVDSSVPDSTAEHVLAVVREALANVERHAGASTASVVVHADAGMCSVTVTDDGIGVSEPFRSDGSGPDSPHGDHGPGDLGGLGLVNLGRRAEKLGGSLVVECLPTGGTRLFWKVPLLD